MELFTPSAGDAEWEGKLNKEKAHTRSFFFFFRFSFSIFWAPFLLRHIASFVQSRGRRTAMSIINMPRRGPNRQCMYASYLTGGEHAKRRNNCFWPFDTNPLLRFLFFSIASTTFRWHYGHQRWKHDSKCPFPIQESSTSDSIHFSGIPKWKKVTKKDWSKKKETQRTNTAHDWTRMQKNKRRKKGRVSSAGVCA